MRGGALQVLSSVGRRPLPLPGSHCGGVRPLVDLHGFPSAHDVSVQLNGALADSPVCQPSRPACLHPPPFTPTPEVISLQW